MLDLRSSGISPLAILPAARNTQHAAPQQAAIYRQDLQLPVALTSLLSKKDDTSRPHRDAIDVMGCLSKFLTSTASLADGPKPLRFCNGERDHAQRKAMVWSRTHSPPYEPVVVGWDAPSDGL
ncbi:hypothetical protein DHEL01_v208875 [Diaporthe helianthi]|uniref:Uncharacterized protein n=1 Tax=Diaporthe helianthi TaxID=158607 RepID=A0A2P5HR79_DIAHE|nr:hypothetical protein DHEL01_v208875 [Diaporthe helianthi]